MDRWLGGQWDRIRHKRVIWRTCGQSNPRLERYMATLKGLQIVRYSPAERRYFESIGAFAGEDALIRFGKYPEDYAPWRPDGHAVFPDGTDNPYITNVTQHMVERGDAVGLSFYLAATERLPAVPAGPGSERLPNGVGALSYDEMRLDHLPKARAYLYTGTTPASYTLGLIEAMMVGVPVVSIGPKAWAGPPELFEGHEIVDRYDCDPAVVRRMLVDLLENEAAAKDASRFARGRAVGMFGMDTIGPQWVAFLGRPADKATPVGAWDLVL